LRDGRAHSQVVQNVYELLKIIVIDACIWLIAGRHGPRAKASPKSPYSGGLWRPGISTATLYGWKAKFGGMEVSEAKRLKQLEDENAKLKRLL
jgi:Transposase